MVGAYKDSRAVVRLQIHSSLFFEVYFVILCAIRWKQTDGMSSDTPRGRSTLAAALRPPAVIPYKEANKQTFSCGQGMRWKFC
jgi:hypothetical protein